MGKDKHATEDQLNEEFKNNISLLNMLFSITTLYKQYEDTTKKLKPLREQNFSQNIKPTPEIAQLEHQSREIFYKLRNEKERLTHLIVYKATDESKAEDDYNAERESFYALLENTKKDLISNIEEGNITREQYQKVIEDYEKSNTNPEFLIFLQAAKEEFILAVNRVDVQPQLSNKTNADLNSIIDTLRTSFANKSTGNIKDLFMPLKDYIKAGSLPVEKYFEEIQNAAKSGDAFKIECLLQYQNYYAKQLNNSTTHNEFTAAIDKATSAVNKWFAKTSEQQGILKESQNAISTKLDAFKAKITPPAQQKAPEDVQTPEAPRNSIGTPTQPNQQVEEPNKVPPPALQRATSTPIADPSQRKWTNIIQPRNPSLNQNAEEPLPKPFNHVQRVVNR